MSSLPFIVAVASCAQAFPFEWFCSGRYCRFLPFVAICYARRVVFFNGAMPAVPLPFLPLPIFTLQALVPLWCCRFLNFACKFFQRFYLIVCIFPFYLIRPKARIFFSAWFGFPSVSRETDSSRFSRKKFQKIRKKFSKNRQNFENYIDFAILSKYNNGGKVYSQNNGRTKGAKK